MRYRAHYRCGEILITTRWYLKMADAWDALERSLSRRGIDPGPWHMPGTVRGDLRDRLAAAARANGAAWIEGWSDGMFSRYRRAPRPGRRANETR